MKPNRPLIFQIEPSDYYSWFFESVVGLELAARRLRHTFHGAFGYIPELPEVINQREVIASELDRNGRVSQELRAWDNGFIEIKIERNAGQGRRTEVWGYFDTMEAARECLSIMVTHFPSETPRPHDDTATVYFWNAAMVRSDYQARRESQTVCVPQWQQIAANYPARVRRELAHLMELQGSLIAGSRLMLWRGLPGTGTTWALRALIREWADWCTAHYVIDSAVFFSNISYMLSLLSKLNDAGELNGDSSKWNLIILEDAGEFITIDSRNQYGQALARLLNLSDGLLGQGQKLLILITTNEEVTNLHPAIVRQGRCLVNLEFPEFSEAEACEWLKSRGYISESLPKRMTLSELYASAASQPSIVNAAPSSRVGFIR